MERVVLTERQQADPRRFRSLSKTSTPQSETPPPISSSNARSRTGHAATPPRGSAGRPSSPPYKNYINFLSNTNDDWKADEDEMMGYDDDDGDDFGLPSLSSMKRRARRRETEDNNKSALGSPTPGVSSSPWGGQARTRRHSGSADIAIERPAPSYPMPKKSEGKILRPQYKEILRGEKRQTTPAATAY